jgi:hypothetical protein
MVVMKGKESELSEVKRELERVKEESQGFKAS